MMRPLLLIAAGLCAGTAFGQSVLVNTRLHSLETLRTSDSLQLDLRDYFQSYASPGPVATFTIFMPEPDGLREFTIGNQPVETMAYQLTSGDSYDDPYAVSAEEFVWNEHTVEFQLLPQEAPVSVANFMTYARDGAYRNTIVHRNESTGRAFRPGGQASFQPLPIIQSGGFRLYPDDDFLLEWVPTREPIPFEESLANSAGTLAMARTADPNSATSQFFINLENNERSFGSAYAVFGQLLDPEADQPVLDAFADAPIYDLSTPFPNGDPNVFPSLPFSSLPLYAPFWNEKASYARFASVTVPAGDPDGVEYSWEWVDSDDETSDEEAANRAAFNIAIDGSILRVSRSDSGTGAIRVKGGSANGEAEFIINLLGYHPGALDQFPGGVIHQDGWLESDWYGWVYGEAFPRIFHANHGHQRVIDDGDWRSLYAYDQHLRSIVYTSTAIYPVFYIHRIGKWVQYQEDTGNGIEPSRWFYLFDSDNSGWVHESEL
jgi:cyclophilin family peptidyl-prolyl cis-trans isomerase